jgi:hypothetical protein
VGRNIGSSMVITVGRLFLGLQPQKPDENEFQGILPAAIAALRNCPSGLPLIREKTAPTLL